MKDEFANRGTGALPKTVSPESSVSQRLNELQSELMRQRQQVLDHPQTNPVFEIADQLSHQLEAGEIRRAEIEGIVQLIANELICDRAGDLAARIGLAGLADARQRVASILSSHPKEPADHPAIGVVLTAHPTFALDRSATEYLIAATGAAGENGRDISLRPDTEISLEYEHDEASRAMENFRGATRWLGGLILDIARENGDPLWRQTNPIVATGASWVGYDLDGRTDIAWRHSFCLRLSEKASALDRLGDELTALAARSQEVAAVAGKVCDAAELARADTARFLDAGDDITRLAEAANALTRSDERLRSSEVLAGELTALANTAPDDQLARDLLLLAAETRNFGFGIGAIHLRINAVQIRNAMRGIDGHEVAGSPMTDENNRLQLARLTDLIASAKPINVNFNSLIEERTTAKRQILLAAQILKHIDSAIPIRFLIAECETPTTVLSALYLARLFGVSDMLDISPLFETPAALEGGARLIERLLETPAYCDYIKRRGRICIQTGFSDAGRFIGQPAAVLAIERLHAKIARILGKYADLGSLPAGFELVVFNTHGESVGRGAHPGSIGDRMDYLMSNHARSVISECGLALCHETSFQGRDGFLHFATPDMARATLLALFEWHRSPARQDSDPFYEDTDFTLNFFSHPQDVARDAVPKSRLWRIAGHVRDELAVQDGIPGFKASIQCGTPRLDPSSIRAIPHNALLQQLGYLINIIGGIGHAAALDLDRFGQLAENSPRFRLILDSVVWGKRLSSLSTLMAYCRIVDPSYWINRAYAGGDQSITYSCRATVRHRLRCPGTDGFPAGWLQEIRLLPPRNIGQLPHQPGAQAENGPPPVAHDEIRCRENSDRPDLSAREGTAGTSRRGGQKDHGLHRDDPLRKFDVVPQHPVGQPVAAVSQHGQYIASGREGHGKVGARRQNHRSAP